MVTIDEIQRLRVEVERLTQEQMEIVRSCRALQADTDRRLEEGRRRYNDILRRRAELERDIAIATAELDRQRLEYHGPEGYAARKRIGLYR
jgi:hypothetical protein